MLILGRLTSRSSRSLAVMIGYARAGFGHARGGRSGSPDDAEPIRAQSAVFFLPFPSPRPVSTVVRRNTSGGDAFSAKGE